MFTGRNRGRGRGRGGNGSTKKVPLKGLFKSGVWHCNCDPRLPAQHFPTKKEGKNHGRWFYTCQHTEPKRCDFFLWEDDAKPREEAAVLSNSRTEPIPPPQTPVKPSFGGLSTPQSSAKKESIGATSPSFSYNQTPSKTSPATPSFWESPTQNDSPTPMPNDEEPEEFYDWLPSDDDELSKVAESTATKLMPPPSTPRKAQKTETFATPGKRQHDEINQPSIPAWPTPPSITKTPNNTDDIFTTPSTNPKSENLFSTTPTPLPTPTTTPLRPNPLPTDLTTTLLATLQSHNIPLSPQTTTSIRDVANKHALFTHGVLKARDISRAMIATKNEKIAELQAVVAALQAERETDRAVIRHLRREAREGRGGFGEGGGGEGGCYA